MPGVGYCNEGCECICGYCTCGHHPCHNKKRPVVKKISSCEKLGESEYKTQFPQLPLERRQESFKPHAEYASSEGPFETKTNYKIDYIPHDLETARKREVEVYQKPEMAMDNQTMYSINYKGEIIPPRKPIKPSQEMRSGGPFSGVTVYKEDYSNWDPNVAKRVRSCKPEETWTPPQIKFQGESCSKASYKDLRQAMRGCLKTRAPTHASVARSDAPLGTSDYHDTYVQHKLLPRITQSPLEYTPSQAPFDGLTTTKRDYTGEQGARSTIFRPKQEYIAPDAPLLAETTSKVDFKHWQVERPAFRQCELYCKPEGSVDYTTIYKVDYDEKKCAASKSCKPIAVKSELGKFDGLTNYTNEFQGWSGHRPAMATSKQEIVLSSAPFDGTTQYKQNFIKYDNVKPRESCKVVQKPQETDGQVWRETTYNVDYTKKCPDCPVNHLGEPTCPFHLTGQVSDIGHILAEHDADLVPVLPPIAA